MAEIIGAISAVSGLFGNCLHAYRVVATAVEFGSDYVTWDVQMRIERFRFEIWPKMLGLLDPQTGETPPAQSDPSSFNDILQIEGVRDIVAKTLEAVRGELDKFDKTVKKYRLAAPQEPQAYEPLTKQYWWRDPKMRDNF